jgi:hypothetical protein
MSQTWTYLVLTLVVAAVGGAVLGVLSVALERVLGARKEDQR